MRNAFRSLMLAGLLAFAAPAAAAPGNAAEDGRRTAEKAIAFLKTQQQENGGWQKGDRDPPAVTALVIRALARDPKHGPQSDPMRNGVAFLLAVQKEDGGIYKDGLANYNTAIAISGLAAVGDPALRQPIERAVQYLKANQFSDAIAGPKGERIDAKHPFHGGWGYGGAQGRPDLSNVGVVIEGLKEAGLDAKDPAYQSAVAFATRMQNRSESNPAPWAGDDGGFVYSPGKDGAGESSAGEYDGPDGKRMLRSYGSMTYAGLKTMIYAGLSKDDPRVKAAWSWVRGNFTVDVNPGMGVDNPENAKSGIFYYYSTLARALAVYGEPVIVDNKKVAHDWRVELIEKLASIQREDGSFVGDKKWMEHNPVIATVLATLALQDALQDLADRPAK